MWVSFYAYNLLLYIVLNLFILFNSQYLDKLDVENNQTTPSSSGHKNSLRGTRLAIRARSFKEDLFEKISQMRTNSNTLGR